MWVVGWVAVEPVEQSEEEERDEPGGGEAPAPTDFEQQDAEDGDADGGGELGGGVEDGGGEAAFATGKPEADGLGVGGEGGGFADAEKKARGKEAGEVRCEGGGEGGDGPKRDADTTDAADAKAIEQDTDGQLTEGVGRVVGAGKIAKGDGGDAEGGDEGGVRDGKVNAIEVVDKDAEAEQPGDAPAAAGVRLARDGRCSQKVGLAQIVEGRIRGARYDWQRCGFAVSVVTCGGSRRSPRG